MAQPVKIRASYRQDAAYFLRLEEAVEKDDRQPLEWRQDICAQLRALAVRFMQTKSSSERPNAKQKR